MDHSRESALLYFEVGNDFLLREDWASATQAFRTAVQLDPDLTKAHAALGAALGNQGFWTLSVDAHTRALTLAPDDLDTLYNLGVAYGELGRPVEAERYFRRVLRGRPGDHETSVRLGTELAEQERFSEALEQFQAVAGAEPQSAFTATASACAGAALIRLGRTGEARVALERAKVLQPALFAHRPEFAQLLAEVEGV
jgi:Tfp pilus assembly protein PilF